MNKNPLFNTQHHRHRQSSTSTSLRRGYLPLATPNEKTRAKEQQKRSKRLIRYKPKSILAKPTNVKGDAQTNTEGWASTKETPRDSACWNCHYFRGVSFIVHTVRNSSKRSWHNFIGDLDLESQNPSLNLPKSSTPDQIHIADAHGGKQK